MIAHKSPISGIDAMGSRYIATAGYDNQVILWDASAKAGIARSYHDHLANQCRFSPCGKYLVSASSDYTARLWEVPTMQLKALFIAHEDDVEMASFSPDGRRIATASRDHTIGVFQIDGTLECRLRGHSADVISVEWANQGREILSTSDDGTIRRWSPSSGRLIETIDSQDTEIDTAAVDKDGRIYVGNDKGEIVVITGQCVRTLPAHRAGIKRLILDRHHRHMLTASYDRTIKLWELRPNDEPRDLLQAEVPYKVWLRACSFLGDDRICFGTFGSSYATFSLRDGLWDLGGVEDTGGLNAVRLVGGSVYSVGDAGIVYRDGKAVAHLGSLCNFIDESGFAVVTGGHAGILFEAMSGRSIYRHHSPLNCSARFVRQGISHLIVGTYTGEGLVFADYEGQLRHVTTIPMYGNAVKGIAANSSHIFSVCATGAVAFHSVQTLEPLRSIPKAHRKISNGAAALPDGTFASISRDRCLRIWTIDRCEEFATPHDHSIKCIAACPQSGFVATGSYDGSVGVFDPHERRWVSFTRPTAAGISSLCTQTEGHFLASSYDGRVYSVAVK